MAEFHLADSVLFMLPHHHIDSKRAIVNIINNMFSLHVCHENNHITLHPLNLGIITLNNSSG